MPLPIDVIAGTSPPRFVWGQTVTTLVGTQFVEHVATVPTSLEEALLVAVALMKKQRRDIDEQRRELKHMSQDIVDLKKANAELTQRLSSQEESVSFQKAAPAPVAAKRGK